MKTKILIVDDESPARRRLRRQLSTIAGVEVAGEADDGRSAVEAIGELKPDIVLLDVRMPRMDGFEVVSAVGCDRMPVIIFVTAFDEYALQAFEVAAVDYLLKPVSVERLGIAIVRAKRRLEERDADQRALARLLESVPSGREPCLRKIVVKDGERLILVSVRKIAFFRACGNYIEAHTDSGNHLFRGTMERLERSLDPAQFARIHRSSIVNVNRITEIQPRFHGDYEIALDTGKRLRLGRRYRDEFFGMYDPER